MTKEDIRAMLLKGERVTLEAKLAERDVPKSVWDTYSAFANTIGGIILLGVEEHHKEKDPAKRYVIHGVEDADKIKKDFWNTINSDKVNENILVDSDVEVVNMGGVEIVCIRVPQADYRLKPIYLNGNVYKGTYRRNNEGDYHCTERQKGSPYKATLHTHPIELVAMTHHRPLLEKDVLTRLLWSMIPETRAFCPKGLGIVPYLLPSSVALAQATLDRLNEGYDVVMWEKHGVFAVDTDIMAAFDQVDVLNKAAQIYMSARSMGFEPEGMSDTQMQELAEVFGLGKG